ncbi:MAG: hypothetical protein H7Y31_10475 [Chitinophagaceae bacterium]|nr:hypothetical protein [Chitinophagaceae bacterium]
MNGALYNYLLQHKSLSIPGLGTIFIERVPAQSDFVNKQLLPPSYHYRFDKYFDAPDKDFFTYLALQRDMADYEAIRWYNEWAYELRNRIRTDNPIRLEGVGLLHKDHSGDIVFEAEKQVPAYLQPVAAVRVIRSQAKHTVLVGDRELTNDQAVDVIHEEPLRERSRWWIFAIIIVAIALIILFFHFYTNGFSISSLGNQNKTSISR